LTVKRPGSVMEKARRRTPKKNTDCPSDGPQGTRGHEGGPALPRHEINSFEQLSCAVRKEGGHGLASRGDGGGGGLSGKGKNGKRCEPDALHRSKASSAPKAKHVEERRRRGGEVKGVGGTEGSDG